MFNVYLGRYKYYVTRIWVRMSFASSEAVPHYFEWASTSRHEACRVGESDGAGLGREVRVVFDHRPWVTYVTSPVFFIPGNVAFSVGRDLLRMAILTKWGTVRPPENA